MRTPYWSHRRGNIKRQSSQRGLTPAKETIEAIGSTAAREPSYADQSIRVWLISICFVDANSSCRAIAFQVIHTIRGPGTSAGTGRMLLIHMRGWHDKTSYGDSFSES